MCEFASFVLTKNNVYYLETVDSHEDIIEYYNLKDDGNNIIRIELLPPDRDADLLNVDAWEFQIDQDEYPDWTYKGDPTLEEMVRNALEKRIEEQKIGQTIQKGIGAIVKVGYKGTAITGPDGQSIAGYKGTAITGTSGMAIAGEHGIAQAGINGTAIVGYKGSASVGYKGSASVGEHGQAYAGENGEAKAGDGGAIHIQYYDYKEYRVRTLTGYVGEELEKDIYYKVIYRDFTHDKSMVEFVKSE